MLNIGEFARLGQVSPRMLRHYDRLGLLVPERVDPFTGYRSYGVHQLGRLHRLLTLRDLGFTLKQIGGLLDEDPPVEQLRGMLRRPPLRASPSCRSRSASSISGRLAQRRAAPKSPVPSSPGSIRPGACRRSQRQTSVARQARPQAAAAHRTSWRRPPRRPIRARRNAAPGGSDARHKTRAGASASQFRVTGGRRRVRGGRRRVPIRARCRRAACPGSAGLRPGRAVW